MLGGAGDATTGTVDVGNEFRDANAWTRIEDIGR